VKHYKTGTDRLSALKLVWPPELKQRMTGAMSGGLKLPHFL